MAGAKNPKELLCRRTTLGSSEMTLPHPLMTSRNAGEDYKSEKHQETVKQNSTLPPSKKD